MKQLMTIGLAVVLFVGSLVPPMSTREVIRLPELLTHYQQHQREEGPSLSFWSFLLDHYLLDSHHHKCPNHSHSRLPAFDGGMSGYDFARIPQFILHGPLSYELSSTAVFRLPSFKVSQTLSSLLQPPRW